MPNLYKILIADDSQFIRISVKDMLSEDVENSYTVFSASNGLEACKVAWREKPDLILIDIEMPVMSGIEAILKIKSNKHLKHIPVVVMSSTKQFQEAFTAGGDDFLLKPFTAYELLMRIQLNLKLAEKSNEVKKQNELLNEQKREAIEQRDIIFQQKKDLLDDLHYARHVQNAIMPSAEDLNNILKASFVFNRPKYIVSGDFYWVSKRNELTIIAVGDCTGHGVSGALMTIAGVAFLNEIILSSDKLRADEVLNALRDKVIHFLKQKGDIGEASNGMDIALCIYNEKSQVLQFAGANNILYLVRKGNPLQIYRGDRMPIGFFFQQYHPFSVKEIRILKDDTIYLFSDGYVDQFGGTLGKKFRYAQFRELIQKMAVFQSMEHQLVLLQETMDKWMQGQEQTDDMLIMGARF